MDLRRLNLTSFRQILTSKVGLALVECLLILIIVYFGKVHDIVQYSLVSSLYDVL